MTGKRIEPVCSDGLISLQEAQLEALTCGSESPVLIWAPCRRHGLPKAEEPEDRPIHTSRAMASSKVLGNCHSRSWPTNLTLTQEIGPPGLQLGIRLIPAASPPIPVTWENVKFLPVANRHFRSFFALVMRVPVYVRGALRVGTKGHSGPSPQSQRMRRRHVCSARVRSASPGTK